MICDIIILYTIRFVNKNIIINTNIQAEKNKYN